MDEFAGIDGFLGTRASLMIDALILIMVVVVVALAWSVWQVKYRSRYRLHKFVQVPLGISLLAVVVIFELDIRLNGWQDRAAGVVGGTVPTAVWIALGIHLACAISSVLLWPIVIVRAVRSFGSSPKPGPHSSWHKPWARVAATDLVLTAITGWVFYVVAFV
ncbi:DUF420 domain-containing protein [Nocardia sp. NPDC049707]|uniref:DUF420 domain-containing protein n=1 Tax=Nocardia sp. NPDC049707 TaxID=3154735 RepID=UPI0034461513